MELSRMILQAERQTGRKQMRKQYVAARGEVGPETLSPSRQITLDSPIEDLRLSRRVQNALQEAACFTVRSLLEHDFSKAARQLGSVAEEEIILSLAERGFGAPGTLAAARDQRISSLEEELQKLRISIDSASRQWQSRVKRLEDRLQKLSTKSRSA